MEHRDQLRHQHQLAGLRRRSDDELSDADARAHRPELRFGGNRYGGRHCPHPRDCPAGRPDGGQLLGGSHAHDALHPAAPFHRAFFGPGLAGCRPDTGRIQNCGSAAADDGLERRLGNRAGARGRACRIANRHQAAGHQRRRVLQRQLGTSLRECDTALELLRGACNSGYLGGPVLHVREDGGRYAPGMGTPGGDDGHLRCLLGAGRVGRAKR